MKILRYFLLLAGVTAVQAAPLQVVVTTPDIADITRRVGADEVEVFCISSGREDPHNVPMRPSAITKMAKAELFIEQGLELEHAYAPALLEESRNATIRPPNGPGFLDLSRGVKPLDVPTSLDRSMGDVHPEGSPHYNLDPVYGQMMARSIAAKLSSLRPEGAGKFKANSEAFVGQIQAKLPGWKAKLTGKNLKFVTYHPDFSYFAARFGLTQTGTIQPKPGIEPGPKDVEALAQKMKATGTKLILKESFYSDRIPKQLAEVTGAKVISVPVLVNGVPAAKDYISLIDTLVNSFNP
jgi:zinc/manganese transport system substrate-binding protein